MILDAFLRPKAQRHPRWLLVARRLGPAWITLAASLALSALGVYAIDVGLRSTPGGIHPVALKQLQFIAIGVVASAVIALPHYHIVGRLAWPAMTGVVALLVFVLLPFIPDSIVHPRNGTRGWINLGVSDLQPSELAKVAFVLAAARYLRFRSEHRRFLGLVPPALIAAVPFGLIVLEPDLGQASLFIPVLLAILLAAGARLRHLAIIVAAAALLAPAIYPALAPHQKARIVSLIGLMSGNEEAAGADVAFQARAARTLIGAGGPAGVGDAHARALVRFCALPEPHNDMIPSVIGVRFGLAGIAGLLALYAAWGLGAILSAARCRDPFARLIGVGVVAFVLAQATVNIGMNVGVLPIIGVTLPFVSYGGSSVVTSWLMAGLVVSIAAHRVLPPYRPSFEYTDA